jgi:hypothetical protein
MICADRQNSCQHIPEPVSAHCTAGLSSCWQATQKKAQKLSLVGLNMFALISSKRPCSKCYDSLFEQVAVFLACSGPGVLSGAAWRDDAALTAGWLIRRIPHRSKLQRRLVHCWAGCKHEMRKKHRLSSSSCFSRYPVGVHQQASHLSDLTSCAQCTVSAPILLPLLLLLLLLAAAAAQALTWRQLKRA